MENMFCALGCSPTKNLYFFPSRIHDIKRRKAWLDFFDLVEPNTDYVFACERHFSHIQSSTEGIRTAAVPDIPIACVGSVHPFRRKPKNWRKNVIVVTPRDPEFTIYRHETGVFPQNLFNPDAVQPVIKMPIIKSVSCSMSTQTNTRLCGLVESSDINEEYRLSCFYCSEMFGMEKWSKFVNHLKSNHFEREETFKNSNYLSQDHAYASQSLPPLSSVKYPIKFNTVANSIIQLPPTQPVLLQPITMPPLFPKPQKYSGKLPKRIFETFETIPVPISVKPHQSKDKLFNITLADRLIKLLNETVLSPNFLNTEEDNILIIKNTGSDNIETSTFLTNLMNPETSPKPTPQTSKNPTISTLSSRYSRPIYTINYGQQNVPSSRYSLSRILLPPLPKNKRAKLVQKRIAQQTLKSINVFEKVYKTVKTRHPKLIEPENDPLTDNNTNKVNEREISNLTPLRRCLKRTITDTMPKTQKPTEIVFEYTPKDIIVSLLECMKKFPVLWEFHNQPFNKDYVKAIEELCRLINEKWSLNITLLKMRRSLNRILRFYQFMLPCESIDEFEDYFNKCALFLPSSADAIPRARCAYCCICFEKDGELRKHIIDRHKSLKWPYKCRNCYERFRESDEYELHKRLPHYEEIFKCERCDKRFNRRHLLNKHVGSHQRSIERSTEIATHLCDVCNKQFRSLPELTRHQVYHEEKVFKCHLCPKEYSINTTLKLHLKRHRRELDFMCEVCGKGFLRRGYLEEHMDTHTGAKVTCNICNLKLRKSNLLRHLRLVHVASEGTIESTFRARSYCYKQYIFPYHRRTRSKEQKPRQYKCKICKITSDSCKVLKDHNKQVHSDIQRTPCKICNIEFIHTSNLKRHYQIKHKLHRYQAHKLVDQNEDLNKVLAINMKDLENMTEVDYIRSTQNNYSANKNNSQDGNYIDQGIVNSDQIQDEIMKAVENLDKQEIRVDDDHSMNDFFTDLLK